MSDISSADLIRVAEGVLSRTRAGEQSWQVFDSAVDEYMTQTQGFLFYVHTRDRDGQPPYVFEVWKKSAGNPSTELGELGTEPNRPANPILEQLWSAARESALGLSKVRDELFKDLGLD